MPEGTSRKRVLVPRSHEMTMAAGRLERLVRLRQEFGNDRRNRASERSMALAEAGALSNVAAWLRRRAVKAR